MGVRAKRVTACLSVAVLVAVVVVTLPTPPDGRQDAGVNTRPSIVELAAPMAPTTDAGPPEAVDVAFADAVPYPEPAVTEEPPPEEEGPCGAALAWVTAAGLAIPSGVGYHCPSTQFAHHGAACWDGPYCAGSGFIAINLELIGGRSTAYLRHVVAHEICHIVDFQATGRTTEARADDCATRHLALREAS